MLLKDFKKATKKEINNIESIFLNNVDGGCSWNDLYKEFSKINNKTIICIKNNWICCDNNTRYKISDSSYIMNYEGVLRF